MPLTGVDKAIGMEEKRVRVLKAAVRTYLIQLVCLYGIANELASCLHVELLEDAGEVRLYRRLGDIEPVRYLLVAKALADENHYIPLPR